MRFISVALRCSVALLCTGTAIVVVPDLATGWAVAQTATETAPSQTADAADAGTVRLVFPDQVELKLLIDYVATKLKIRILYDEKVVGKRITLRAADPVPVASLLDILRSAMAYKGLILKRAAEGWYEVEALAETTRQAPIVPEQADLADMAGRDVATVVIRPMHLSLPKALAAVKPYLSSDVGKDAYLSEDAGVLIVTDYTDNVRKALGMLELLDRPGPEARTETLPIRTMPVGQFLGLLQQHLRDELADATPKPVITSDAVGNILVITASEEAIAEIRTLADLLDRMPEAAEELPETPIGGLVFYTLRNVDAAEAAATLTRLFGGGTLVTIDDTEPGVPAEPSSEGPQSAVSARQAALDRINARQPVADSQRRRDLLAGAAVKPAAMLTYQTAKGPQVTVYPQTNTLIIEATREEHDRIGRILKRLDRRRPQVLLEAIIVEIVADDTWSLGIELEDARLRPGFVDGSHLVFSAFGLSTIDLATGRRTLVPGAGLNAVILSPAETELVLQAVATSGKSRVLSAPAILVNDNATANLQSIREEPFTSINASETVSTTSFAGYEQAGTQLLVTPRIAQGDHLWLHYNVALNSFTGAAPSPSTPPPRATNTISSEVVVPDGYTVVVGGLTNRTKSDTVTKVPLLGDVPWLGTLFQSRTVVDNNVTVYVFLRPVIFRDPAFQDLKHFSRSAKEAAGVDDELPENPPMILESSNMVEQSISRSGAEPGEDWVQ